MALLNVNPAAEVSTGFVAIKPGTYRMKIEAVEDRNPEKNDLRVTLSFVTQASEMVGPDGEALKGNPGQLFDYIMLDHEKQWKLRQITEAAGLPWADYDPIVDLPGRELDVTVKNELYEEVLRNRVGRYIVPK